MKKSIRGKLLVFMSGLVAFVVVIAWLFNNLFLERFYIFSKGRTLLRTMESIGRIYGAEDGDIELELARMQVNEGVQVIIFDANLGVRYMVWQNALRLGFGRRGIVGGPDLLGFIRGEGENRYEISRNYDERLRMEYLDLVGALENGDYVLLRMPVQTITDSVNIANHFLLITGAFCVLISAFISVRLSTRIAKPIRAVEDIARSMSNLDFSRKIAVASGDEIGSLAASINVLSDHLQETIGELQDKNRQLEGDILYISKMDERRKEFLSSVSHELKTPIALIRGYAEALEERVVKSDEDKDYYYHVISDEADKMNALVKKLMNLNNLEAGQDELYLENFDIVALVQSVVKRGKSLQGAEKLNFQLCTPEEAWVYADNFLIEEVVFNYITNAIHYAGGRNLVRVRLRLLPEELPAAEPAEAGALAAGRDAGSAAGLAGAFGAVPGPAAVAPQAPGLPEKSGTPELADDRRVRVEVFNSGSSLNEEERERVWESFYKADKSRSREYGGSGLGLSVVRAAMERHRCAYGADNCEDGVSFWFELPMGEPR